MFAVKLSISLPPETVAFIEAYRVASGETDSAWEQTAEDGLKDAAWWQPRPITMDRIRAS